MSNGRAIGQILGIVVFVLLMVVGIWTYGYFCNHMSLNDFYRYTIIFGVWLFLIFPVGEFLGVYLKKREPVGYQDTGIDKAGKLIGRLERTIVLIFYLGRSLEGIAFLVVAKSIYRFGDLQNGYKTNSEESRNKEEDDITFTVSEYIILGSLMSYTIAIVGGVIVDFLFKVLNYNLVTF